MHPVWSRVALIFALVASGSNAVASSFLDGHSAFQRAIDIARDRELSQSDKLNGLLYVKSDLDAIRQVSGQGEDVVLIDRFMFLDVLSSYSLALKSNHGGAAIDEMASIYDLMQARGINSTQLAQVMYDAYIAKWSLDAANKVAQDSPAISSQQLPKITNPPPSLTPSFYEWDGKEMRLSDAQISSGISIVITAGCGVTDAAIDDVHRDKRLSQALKAGNTLWLIPVSKEIDFSKYFEQVSLYPEQRIVISSDNSSWPEVDFTTTPSIVFFKDGRFLKRMSGWPQSGMPNSELLSTLIELGLY